MKWIDGTKVTTSNLRAWNCCSSSTVGILSWSPSLVIRLRMAALISFSLFSANRCSWDFQITNKITKSVLNFPTCVVACRSPL